MPVDVKDLGIVVPPLTFADPQLQIRRLSEFAQRVLAEQRIIHPRAYGINADLAANYTETTKANSASPWATSNYVTKKTINFDITAGRRGMWEIGASFRWHSSDITADGFFALSMTGQVIQAAERLPCYVASTFQKGEVRSIVYFNAATTGTITFGMAAENTATPTITVSDLNIWMRKIVDKSLVDEVTT